MIVVCFFFNNRNKFLCLLFKKQKNKNKYPFNNKNDASWACEGCWRHTRHIQTLSRVLLHDSHISRTETNKTSTLSSEISTRRRRFSPTFAIVTPRNPAFSSNVNQLQTRWALTWAVGIAKLAMAPSEMGMSGLGWLPHAGITRRRQQTEG